ncbi:hypothetical protein HRG_000457 [Hirsutella rhossiliensis]|uniref:Uncharacterized protein n=1 Tax=Hirsutella rhossiliensis TaxID=111463 RepID=A0A9P8N6G2_9HYPO|nr:uncharacterized protein HRG_00457 [Hirsutella rhossiliensis]KAH0967815.1 hypothetical protein HRG_00457 [Hirsutella rhossiliensis]
MVGHFEPDPELCRQYAQFASSLERWQFKSIYWAMFGTNLIILFLASWIYTKGQQVLERVSLQSEKRARTLRTYILLCAGCVAVSTVVVVMEAFALLALQFCDGEDLMSLYWSTWTMIQIGSLIAMVGIILALLHSLWDSKHPPWALALGTPVLVIAGVLHLFHDCTRTRIKKMRRRSSGLNGSGPSMRKEDTMETARDMDSSGEDTYNKLQVEFIGSTVDGGPIVRFLRPLPKSMRHQGDILGYSDDDRPIMAYRKGVITFAPDPESPGPSKEARSDLTER